MKHIIQITAPHFCAGVTTENGFISAAAPILRWAIGRSAEWLQRYCRGKGWKFSDITEPKEGER